MQRRRAFHKTLEKVLQRLSNLVHRSSPRNIPTSINQLPDNLPTSINQLPDNLPTSINQLPDNLPTSINQLPDNLPTSINQLPDDVPIPINQLPDDVLCYVFEWYCCQQATLALPFRAIPQITLSHVCSTWRRIMLNTPSFWHTVTVTLDYSTAQRHGAIIATARECLSRAQNVPCFLAVRFEMGSTFDIIQQENCYQNLVNDLISPFYFKEIRIAFSRDHLKEFLELPNDKLSCIETLEIHCFDPPSSSSHRNLQPSLTPHSNSHKLANLSSFCLRNNPYGCSDAMTAIFPHIPWHQLRHIQLCVAVPGRTCLDIIRECCTSLETCTLSISDDQSFAEMPSTMLEPIQCSQLRNIGLVMNAQGGNWRHLFEPFLLGIRMPKLKVLEIARSGGPLPIDVTMLNRMKDTSQMRLEEFSISYTSDELDVEALLAVFPLLRRLSLPSSAILTDDTIFKLGAGAVAPCLEDFTLKNPYIELGKLLQMTKTRCGVGEINGATPFKSVTFYDWTANCMGSAYRTEINAIILCGVRIQLRLPPYEIR